MKKLIFGALFVASGFAIVQSNAEMPGGQGYTDITSEVKFSPGFVGIHSFSDNPMSGGYITVLGEKIADYAIQERSTLGIMNKIHVGTWGTRDLVVDSKDFQDGLAKVSHVVMGSGPVMTHHGMATE